MRKIFLIILLGIVGFLISMVVFTDWRNFVVAFGQGSIAEPAMGALGGACANVANMIYTTPYGLLYWTAGCFCVATVLVVVTQKVLWPRRHGILHKTKPSTSTSDYQDQLSTPELYSTPKKQTTETKSETPKTEKEVEAK